MGKVANRYLKVDPWLVMEDSFHTEQSRVSESIFSLGNEYMGIRGYFEEGFSGSCLVGSYFNGFYEESPVEQAAEYKGFIKTTRFMVNTIDWLFTRITVDGETLDLARSKFKEFKRALDFKEGTLTREFVWQTKSGKELKLSFIRFVSMAAAELGVQRISLTALNFSVGIEIQSGLDFSIIHEQRGKNFWICPMKNAAGNSAAILGKTNTLGHMLFSGFNLKTSKEVETTAVENEKFSGLKFTVDLKQNETCHVDKIVTNITEKDIKVSIEDIWNKGNNAIEAKKALTFETALNEHIKYWSEVWDTLDINIEGDPENQQGIRFCIFQLHQTYHGAVPGNNIGAKGLTGEAYNGHTFWDTETFCLQFYLFNNIKAARNLLEYRYKTLPQAMERARELDCKGAFYPFATIDGSEACGLWQQANIQLQVSSAVSYGVWHYHKISNDKNFLYTKGAEMLIQISRCCSSRGQWGAKTGEYGFYIVMGPDEFHMMVNNNCYLNYMAKRTFEFTVETLNNMKKDNPELLKALQRKVDLKEGELSDWQNKAKKMKLPQDKKTKVFEQFEGYFDFPHIDIHSIPVTDFPLYQNWSYDRIYRYDMIKQPDVLMFMFLYNQSFTKDEKKANYEYYEPRCIHESSLSPSIHSILAAEIGLDDEAFNFCRFATRLDLDNYNRNTHEGLHTTSIAAAWMNITYGFGGMRSDGDGLNFSPSIPKAWDSYSFGLIYQGSTIKVHIGKTFAEFKAVKGNPVKFKIYGKEYKVDSNGIKVKLA